LASSNQCVWTSVMTTILLRRKPSNASSLHIPQSLQVPAVLCFEPKQLRMFNFNKPIIYRKLLMLVSTIYICIMKPFVMLDSGQRVYWNSFDLHNLTNTLPVALHNCPAYGSSCQMKVLSNFLQDMLGSNCSQRAYNGPHKPSRSFIQKRASTDQTMHCQPR
jgi:type IV secretory pathway VirB6-like protein